MIARPPARTSFSEPVRVLKPGWPLGLLLCGFPLFWALGLSTFATQIMAVPMAWSLYQRRPLKIPRGFAFWLLFLLWTAIGLLLPSVNPPGYVPGTTLGRLFGYGTRETHYLAVTVVLLYIGNLREDELPTERIVRWLGWFFVAAVAGGVLGMTVPNLNFQSLVELVLPGNLRSNHAVQQLVHPRSAQVQELISDATPRPAAPFSYTNAWGFHVSLLAVWFVVARFFLPGSRHRVAAAIVLALGMVTLVYSLNRAAWLGIALAVVLLALRFALRGRLVLVGGLLLVAAIGVGVVQATPLGTVVAARMANGKSDDIRAFTTEKAIDLSTESPVVGFGSTRSTSGSASSIAVGKSADCPQCGNANIGMNGYLYMMLVTTGYVGAALFFTMGGVLLWRTRRRWTATSIGGGIVILMSAFYALFYDGSTWLLVPFVSLGVLWREDQRAHAAPTQREKGDVDGLTLIDPGRRRS